MGFMLGNSESPSKFYVTVTPRISSILMSSRIKYRGQIVLGLYAYFLLTLTN